MTASGRNLALGEALRRERTRRKERQADAATRFGVSQPSYHRWESGENRPDDAQFADVARYLGMTVAEVWELVHGADAAPVSLEALRGQVAAVERDLADVREMVRRIVSELAPPDGQADQAKKAPSKKAAAGGRRARG